MSSRQLPGALTLPGSSDFTEPGRGSGADSLERAWQPAASRIVWADWVRLAAAFAVVMLHVSAVPLVHMNDVSSSSWGWALALNVLSRASVPLFIMLSGALLLAQQPWSTAPFLRRRAARLVGPMVAWTLLYALWRQEIQGKTVSGEALLGQVLDGFNSPAYPHLWFLWVIAGLYLLAPILLPFVQRASAGTHAYFAVLWVIVTTFLPAVQHWTGLQVGLYLQPLTGYVGYFVVGACIHRSLPVLPRRGFALALGVFVMAALAAAAGTYWMADASTGRVDESLLHPLSAPALAMSLSAFLLIRHLASGSEDRAAVGAAATPRAGSAMLARLSALTLGIYLVHPLAIDLLDLSGLTLDPLRFPAFWYVPVVTVLVFALSAAATRILQASRLSRWLVP